MLRIGVSKVVRQLDHFLIRIQTKSVPVDHRAGRKGVPQIVDSWAATVFLEAAEWSQSEVLRDERKGVTSSPLTRGTDPNPTPASPPINLLSQRTFGVMPLQQILPALLIARKSHPSRIPLASVQRSIAALTHDGIGTVLMCPPFPYRSAITRVILSELDARETERENLSAPEPAAEKKGEDHIVAPAPKIRMPSGGE